MSEDRPWFSLVEEEPDAPDLPYDVDVEVKGHMGDDTVAIGRMATGVYDWLGFSGDPTHWRPLPGSEIYRPVKIPESVPMKMLVEALAEHRLFATKENFVSGGGEWREGQERVHDRTLVFVTLHERGGKVFEMQDGKETVRFNQCYCMGAVDIFQGAVPTYDAKYVVEHMRPLTYWEKGRIIHKRREELEAEMEAQEKMFAEILPD